jgi:hypothetical protein
MEQRKSVEALRKTIASLEKQRKSSIFCCIHAHRLGLSGRTGREWFTKYSLFRALHTRPEEIQKWIDRGWLKSRTLALAGTQAKIIDRRLLPVCERAWACRR